MIDVFIMLYNFSSFYRNIIHGSDSAASAEKEIALWFSEEELCNYDLALDKWISEAN